MSYKGLAGFIANIAIGAWSDTYENNLAKETEFNQRKSDESDKNNGISVIATEI